MAEAADPAQEGEEEAKEKLSPENAKIIKETKEKFLNLLQPKLISQFIAWMEKRDIQVEDTIIGKGNFGTALVGSRPNKKKNEKGRTRRDVFGVRIREPLVVKWTDGAYYLGRFSNAKHVAYLIRELYLSTLISHAYLVTSYWRQGPVIPDHGMVVQERDPKIGFDDEMKPTGGFYMFQEFIHGGTLWNYMNNTRRFGSPNQIVSLQTSQAKCWIRHLIAAVFYLHSNGIVHRDMHQNNIMIDLNGHLRVIDFGVAEQHHYDPNPPPFKLRQSEDDEIEDEEEAKKDVKGKVGLGVPKRISERTHLGMYTKDQIKLSMLIFFLTGKKDKKAEIMAKQNPTVSEHFLKQVATWETDPQVEPAALLELLGHRWLTKADPTYRYLDSSKYAAF